MQKLSLAVKNFNERVKVMNQTGSKQLALTADEARNLHADIFNLLTHVAESQSSTQSQNNSATINSLDGGGF